MIQEELSIEEYCFPKVINTSEESISPKDQSTDVDLAACFHAFFQCNSFPSSIEESEPIKTPEEHRRQALDKSLLKLSTLDMSGKECIEEYLRHQYRRNFQASTIRGSYTGLSCFLGFLKGIGRGGIKEIEKTDLEAFIEHEQDRGIKISTVKLRLAQVKAFLRFMIENGDLSEAVFPWKLTIKVPEPLPRAMDPDDVDKLLAVKCSMRDRAMILLLLRTGMRIGELLRTRMIDVNMEEQKVLIYEGAKNQRGRAVYFSDDAKAALKAWMKERKQSMELLIYGHNGSVLSYAAARMMFVKYLDKAGLALSQAHLCHGSHQCEDAFGVFGEADGALPVRCYQALCHTNRQDQGRRVF